MAKMSAENDRNSMASALCSNEYKVIIIGGLGAGKTSLLLRFVHGVFEDRLSAFVAEEKMTVCVDGCEVVLDIWDTAGRCVCVGGGRGGGLKYGWVWRGARVCWCDVVVIFQLGVYECEVVLDICCYVGGLGMNLVTTHNFIIWCLSSDSN